MQGPSPQPKLTPYLTVIPTRRPQQKTHINIGHAKNAINGKIGAYRGGAECDMQMYEHVEGDWKLLYSIKQGDRVCPWQVEALAKQAEKKEEAARREKAAARKKAEAEAKHYYENVIGAPVGEDYKLFVEGYAEGYMRGRWAKENHS